MNKTLARKFIYIIAALALLVGMLPAVVPVSAAPGDHLVMTIGSSAVADLGYNVTDSVVTVSAVASDGTTPVTNVVAWNLVDQVIGTNSAILTMAPDNSSITVTGVWGETLISATLADGSVIGPVDKKWGQIAYTEISAPGSSYVTWNEGLKEWSGSASASDYVYGDFINKDGVITQHAVQGVILNWYLVAGWEYVDTLTPGEAQDSINPPALGLKSIMAGLTPATFAQIVPGPGVVVTDYTMAQTITDADGYSSIEITTTGEEAIKIVVVPEYPGNPQLTVVPEATSWNFMTREMEVVPQVRWAGEKIVLGANFGIPATQAPRAVRFSLANGSDGSLFAINDFYLNLTNQQSSVWAEIDPVTNLASVILESQDEGVVFVDAGLYALTGEDNMTLINQQAFTVYFLKFESLTLTDVVGKRTGHYTGLFEPENPWDSSLDWEVIHATDGLIDNDTLNVSQDGLLRATIKGWFTSSNPTTRPAGQVDIGGTYPLLLPAGRYVLPDDWATLAGPNNWQERRIHWDIMNAPNDGIVMSVDPLGPYLMGGTSVADYPVIGPFSPDIEIMTNTGWEPSICSTDPLRMNKTVVPNGNLDWWDAPMPPAKVIFEIMEGVGFFKMADKSEIYYLDTNSDGVADLYTNPFYEALIPAHQAIPPFIANGGYDWNSFDLVHYGPYEFWQIINQPDGIVTSPDAVHPTKVEVYSDNHGEAMVYVNGDSNLGLAGNNGGADIIYLSQVGQTIIQSWIDYPYTRGNHQPIYSNQVTKTWLWGGQILGPDAASLAPMVLVAGSDNPAAADYITLTAGTGYTDPAAMGISNKHVVWIWATDRDGLQAGVLGTQVSWNISGAGASFYDGAAFTGINPNAPYSTNLQFDGNGFLLNTAHPGVRAPGSTVTSGTSWLREPTYAEKGIFNKFWPSLDPDNFAVSAIDVYATGSGTVAVHEALTGPDYAYTDTLGNYHAVGTIFRQTNFTTTMAYPLDDQIILGDANLDGNINLMDITAVARIVLGMDQPRIAQADANYNGIINMGDAIRIEKLYFGY